MPISKLVDQIIFVIFESFNLQKRLSVVTSDWRSHWDGSTTSHACDVLNNWLVWGCNISLWLWILLLLTICTLTYWSHIIMSNNIGSIELLNRIKRLFASVFGEPRIHKSHSMRFWHAIFLHRLGLLQVFLKLIHCRGPFFDYLYFIVLSIEIYFCYF